MCIKEPAKPEEQPKDAEQILKEDRDKLVENRDQLFYDPISGAWFKTDPELAKKAVEALTEDIPKAEVKEKVFHTTYVSNGLDMNELELVRRMFAGKKIQVEIRVTTV